MTRIYEFEALTDIWTGDANTARSKTAPRLIPTGLLGSIRWWFEVLVRGFDGKPCDPSQSQCTNDKHCVVCEFFGCTGWARKFRFDVLGESGEIQQVQIKRSKKFKLRFTPLRAIAPEEWALLDLTLRLIADYGALGGKTVLKPSEQNTRIQHADFGLVRCCSPIESACSRAELTTYVSSWTPKISDASNASWASCSRMWFVAGKHLTRQNERASTFNRVIGRPELKSDSKKRDSWLAGSRGMSKKVFSFKEPARTFGFVQQVSGLADMREKLRGVWGLTPPDDWFVVGDAILKRLFTTKVRAQ